MIVAIRNTGSGVLGMRRKQIRSHADSTAVARAIGAVIRDLPTDRVECLLDQVLRRAHGLTLADVRHWRMTHVPVSDGDEEGGDPPGESLSAGAATPRCPRAS